MVIFNSVIKNVNVTGWEDNTVICETGTMLVDSKCCVVVIFLAVWETAT